MILSNKEILEEIRRRNIKIGELTGNEPPDQAPFNTTSVDLKLSSEVYIPKENALAVDLYKDPKITSLLDSNCDTIDINKKTPFILRPKNFILSKTKEKIHLTSDRKCFAARVEGKSSRARCGLTVHCTAPTIHAGFEGHITLEISNLSTWPFLLYPDMYICQLIIEEVKGDIADIKSQYHGQYSATGRSQDQEPIEQTVERILKGLRLVNRNVQSFLK